MGSLSVTPFGRATAVTLLNVDSRTEVREFLTTRRARVRPEDVGLPTDRGNRRVPGLRREELASLAGVSVSYYTRLERGDAAGVSQSVLDAIARVLRLDEAERAHLGSLVRTNSTVRSPRTRTAPTRPLRPAVQRLLDSLIDMPAIVHNARMDVIGANALARALYSDMFETDPRPNLARYMFLVVGRDAEGPDWEAAADELVAILRAASGRDPNDQGLTNLVGELSMHNEDFRRRWAAHDVRKHANGTALFHHPQVGELTFTYESFAVTSEPTLSLKVYSAEPGTPSADKLRLLATWYASRTQESTRTDTTL